MEKSMNKNSQTNGLVIPFQYYCKARFCDKWLKIEKWAREKEKGLWRDKDPVPPWNWRRGETEC